MSIRESRKRISRTLTQRGHILFSLFLDHSTHFCAQRQLSAESAQHVFYCRTSAFDESLFLGLCAT